jgi:hypothetical protein
MAVAMPLLPRTHQICTIDDVRHAAARHHHLGYCFVIQSATRIEMVIELVCFDGRFQDIIEIVLVGMVIA